MSKDQAPGEAVKAEFVEAERTLDEAIHLLAVASHQQRMLTRQGRREDVLRRLDVFQLICRKIRVTCEVPAC